MEHDKLAVIFPGMGYHSDKPLLYYSKRLSREHGYEIIEISYGFQVRARDIMNDKDGRSNAFLHAVSETKKQLAEVDFGSYRDVLFIGKSIGTTVAAFYDKENGINARHIVFTPVTETFEHLRDGCGIVFHGTADPWCDTDLAENKTKELHLELIKVVGANHSLETGDAIVDSRRMPEILEKVNDIMM